MATKRATSNDIYQAYLLSINGAITFPTGCRALLAHYQGKSKGRLLSKQELLTEIKRLMGDSIRVKDVQQDKVEEVTDNRPVPLYRVGQVITIRGVKQTIVGCIWEQDSFEYTITGCTEPVDELELWWKTSK